MKNLGLIVSTIIAPAVLFFANILLRYRQKLPLSTAADIFLVFLVFDVGVWLDPKSFSPLADSNYVRHHLVGLFTGYFFIGLIAWLLIVVVFEEMIVTHIDGNQIQYLNQAFYWPWLLSWALALMLIATHIMTFAY